METEELRARVCELEVACEVLSAENAQLRARQPFSVQRELDDLRQINRLLEAQLVDGGQKDDKDELVESLQNQLTSKQQQIQQLSSELHEQNLLVEKLAEVNAARQRQLEAAELRADAAAAEAQALSALKTELQQIPPESEDRIQRHLRRLIYNQEKLQKRDSLQTARISQLESQLAGQRQLNADLSTELNNQSKLLQAAHVELRSCQNALIHEIQAREAAELTNCSQVSNNEPAPLARSSSQMRAASQAIQMIKK